MRGPVGELLGIHETTPPTYKYAHDRGQMFDGTSQKLPLDFGGQIFERLSV